jgi:hypothetical protein
MHFVDDVNFHAAAGRQKFHLLADLAHVIHAVIGGAVDFEYVDGGASVDIQAARAFVAGDAGVLAAGLGFRIFAAKRFGKNTGHGGFAYAAGAGKEVGLAELILFESVDERRRYVLLPNQFIELLRAVFSGEYDV